MRTTSRFSLSCFRRGEPRFERRIQSPKHAVNRMGQDMRISNVTILVSFPNTNIIRFAPGKIKTLFIQRHDFDGLSGAQNSGDESILLKNEVSGQNITNGWCLGQTFRMNMLAIVPSLYPQITPRETCHNNEVIVQPRFRTTTFNSPSSAVAKRRPALEPNAAQFPSGSRATCCTLRKWRSSSLNHFSRYSRISMAVGMRGVVDRERWFGGSFPMPAGQS